jgi:RimJ/RimL family protein N-acetyltransferase
MAPDTTAIRALGAGDLAAYCALRLRGFAEHPAAFTSSHAEESARPVDALRHRIEPPVARPHDGVLGAFAGGTLVGMVGLEVDMRAHVRHKGHVFGMYVPVEHAGRGIGKALVAAVIRRAQAIPALRQLGLTVTAGNAAARRLYEAAGFVAWGIEPDAVIVDGAAHDKIHMTRALARP